MTWHLYVVTIMYLVHGIYNWNTYVAQFRDILQLIEFKISSVQIRHFVFSVYGFLCRDWTKIVLSSQYQFKYWQDNISILCIPLLSSCSSSHVYRVDSRFAPSQWETALLCNDVSHWLGANLEAVLCLPPVMRALDYWTHISHCWTTGHLLWTMARNGAAGIYRKIDIWHAYYIIHHDIGGKFDSSYRVQSTFDIARCNIARYLRKYDE